MGLSERLPESTIENDKDDPLGKLVEFSNRFSTTSGAGIPASDPGRISNFFDAANSFMTYPNYSYQQAPVWQNPTISSSISSTTPSTNGTGSPPTWWSALAGAAVTCDPASAWLNYSTSTASNNSEVANAAAVAVAAYGTPYLGTPFSTLPTAGLLPNIPPLGTAPISSTSPGFNSSNLLASPTMKPKNPRSTSKTSSKTSCECPNCHETSRIG